MSFSPRKLHYCSCKTSYSTLFHQTHCTSRGPFLFELFSHFHIEPPLCTAFPPLPYCLFLFLALSCLSSLAPFQLSGSPQPIGPPVQQDHDAQQLCGGAQPGRNERPQQPECSSPERGALLQHLRGHVQPGEESWQRGSRLCITGWQQEAALQSGCQDGGHCGIVAVEQEHAATQPARSVYNLKCFCRMYTLKFIFIHVFFKVYTFILISSWAFYFLMKYD